MMAADMSYYAYGASKIRIRCDLVFLDVFYRNCAVSAASCGPAAVEIQTAAPFGSGRQLWTGSAPIYSVYVSPPTGEVLS